VSLEAADEGPLPAPVLVEAWGRLPEQQLAQAEIRQLLQQAISSLPEHYRLIFLLREVEGLSTAETAEVAGISVSAAKVRLHRARLQLRERLAEQFVTLA
jgi:RNA polymerase sigma-70 factor (ECF subfamily)